MTSEIKRNPGMELDLDLVLGQKANRSAIELNEELHAHN